MSVPGPAGGDSAEAGAGLADLLVRGADGPGVLSVHGDPGSPHPWAAVLERSLRFAGALSAAGAGPGARVALVADTTLDAVCVIEAVWLLGASLTVLPGSVGTARRGADQPDDRLRSFDPDVVVVGGDVEPERATVAMGGGAGGGGRGGPVLVLSDLAHESARCRPACPERTSPEAVAVVQYTSGSTSEPKGVRVTHGNVRANVAGIVERLDIRADTDAFVSWLPLYHDMGLFGFLAVPMTTGCSAHLASPLHFVADPGMWMRGMAAFGGTITGGPNFAFAMATRAMRAASPGDLGRARWVLDASEPVDPSVLRRFTDAGAAHGLACRAVSCGFGLAESTLAVTLQAPGEGLRTETVDRHALETSGMALAFPALTGAAGTTTTETVLLGPPIPGTDVRVRRDGAVLPEGQVGEIEVRGASVARYYEGPSGTVPATSAGWLPTGDLGYLRDGQLVVCGRAKDVIVIAGRNVFPQDIERVVGSVPGVRPGNVVAVPVSGRGGLPRVGVLAEWQHPDVDAAALRDEIRLRVREEFGTRLHSVVLVAPGSVPKTSSGKLRRSEARRLVEQERPGKEGAGAIG